jgi:hypothetical protein
MAAAADAANAPTFQAEVSHLGDEDFRVTAIMQLVIIIISPRVPLAVIVSNNEPVMRVCVSSKEIERMNSVRQDACGRKLTSMRVFDYMEVRT